MDNCGRRSPTTDDQGSLAEDDTPRDENGVPLVGRWIGSCFYTPAPELPPEPPKKPLPSTARLLGEPLACGCTVWEPNEICSHWRNTPTTVPEETWQDRIAQGLPPFSKYRLVDDK